MSDSPWHQLWQKVSSGPLLRSAPLGLVVLIGAFLSYRSHAILHQDRDMVVHTYQVIGTLHTTLLAIEEAESAQGGFVITGDPAFLALYEKAKDQLLPATMGDLTRLLVRNAPQRERFTRLRSMLEAKLSEIQSAIEVRRTQGFAAAQALIQRQADRRRMNEIRTLVAEMDTVERHLLVERDQHVAQSERRIWLMGGITAALSMAVRAVLAICAPKGTSSPA